MILLTGFAFLAGIVTVLSPCILPVLPLVLTGSLEKGKSRPLGVVAGFIASFTFFTLTLSLIVQSIGINPDIMRWVAAALIIIFGFVLVLPKLKDLFARAMGRIVNRFFSARPVMPGTPRGGFLSGFLLGASLGLIWTPCVGPIMASVISLSLSSAIDSGSVLITLAYSTGTAIPLFIILVGGRALLNRFPFFLRNSSSIQRVFGILMLVTGLAVITGFDRNFQTWILQTFPKYGTGLTVIEDTQGVRDELAKRRSAMLNMSVRIPDHKDPFSLASGVWINSEPLSLSELKGKVVLVDFWTYSCINCLRTIPFLKAWHERYADKGLVIVGVHSPEFAFERDEGNVRRAVQDLGVVWPVVQDNTFAVWKSFSNRYWPAHYLFDKTGALVDTHFGEGKYVETEMLIQMLLGLSGDTVAASIPSTFADDRTRSPETYIGYLRAENYSGIGQVLRDKPMNYSVPSRLGESTFALEGRWTVGAESAVNQGKAALVYRFNARRIYLVMNPMPGVPTTVKVSIDGKPVTGGDVKNGILLLDKNRLYQLYDGDRVITATIRLEFTQPVKIFAFTFG